MGKGGGGEGRGSCSSPVCGKLSFQTSFSCILALKLDKERVMEDVVTMPSPLPNGLKINLFSFLL